MNKNIKILYCYDENKNLVYYTNTIKGNKYYCIECGDELLVKDGVKNQKHLSHKANSACESNGESVIHNHYKTNLFIPGAKISTRKGCAEIYNVIVEQFLDERYPKAKNWDRKIKPDVILETSLGDVIIEIWNTNKKDWNELVPYYNEIIDDLCDVFEVKINSINDLSWKSYARILYLIEKNKQKKIEAEKATKEKTNEIIYAIKHMDTDKSKFYYYNLKPLVTENVIQICGVIFDEIDGRFKESVLRIRYKTEENKQLVLNRFFPQKFTDEDILKCVIEYKYIKPKRCRKEKVLFLKACSEPIVYTDDLIKKEWSICSDLLYSALLRSMNDYELEEIIPSKYEKYFELIKDEINSSNHPIV